MELLRTYVRQNFSLILISVLIFYFFLAALQGQMGFFRYLQVDAQINAASKELSALEEERARLENLTKRLSNDYLDLDLLDEQARKKLGLIREDEIIIR